LVVTSGTLFILFFDPLREMLIWPLTTCLARCGLAKLIAIP